MNIHNSAKRMCERCIETQHIPLVAVVEALERRQEAGSIENRKGGILFGTHLHR